MTSSPVRIASTAATLVIAMAMLAQPAEAGGLWDNCTSYNQKFPHGVGKRNAVDKTSGTPVTNFKKSNKKYAKAMRINDDLDRDKDKIACEKA